MTINDLVNQCHQIARNHGFWDQPREVGTMIALIHSEVSEAMEANSSAEFVEELADIVIRIADLCGGLGIDLQRMFPNQTLDILQAGCHHYVPYDTERYFGACRVSRQLSKALEMDRLEERDLFEAHIAVAFFTTFEWAAARGYHIVDAITQKMEKNKARPHLHGKSY